MPSPVRPPTEADAALLLKRSWAQRQIENGLHWVRNVTFGEDVSQAFKGQAPEVFAILRNAASLSKLPAGHPHQSGP